MKKINYLTPKTSLVHLASNEYLLQGVKSSFGDKAPKEVGSDAPMRKINVMYI